MASNWDFATDKEFDEGLEAYPLDSAKHPTWVERMSDWAYLERKRRQEEEPPPFPEPDPED